MLEYICNLDFLTIKELINSLFIFELGLKTGKINSELKEDLNI